MAAKDALEMAKKNKAEIVDLKFIDVPGLWQHFSIGSRTGARAGGLTAGKRPDSSRGFFAQPD